MKKTGVFSSLLTAAALVVAAALVTGCSPSVENNGGSGTENTAEKRMYFGKVAEPKGELSVTVQGEKASASFMSEGKTYKGEGTVASDGAVAVELASEADSQNKYAFSGSYDKEKKAFSKGQFGKAGGALKDVMLSSEKGGKVLPFYYGMVYPTGLKEYEVTITVKSESKVAILFARKTTDPIEVEGNRRDKVYVQVEGALSGNKVTADVRLEGEDFIFKTVLHDDGFLRQTQLLGERGFTGERKPTLIYEYEAKGIDEHASKNKAEHFKGDLTVTMHFSPKAYEEAKAKKNDTFRVGHIFVTFHELSDGRRTRMYKGHRPLTKSEYEKGIKVSLYNLLDRKSEIAEEGVDPAKPGNIANDVEKPSFVFLVKAKEWYNKDKHSFKGVMFGRAKSRDVILGKGHAVSEKLVHVK